MDSVTTVNVTGAAVVMQIALLLIMFCGGMILKRDDQFPVSQFEITRTSYHLFLWIGAIGLVTLSVLVFSAQFSDVWRPLFRDLHFPTIDSSDAIAIVFVVDVFLVGFLAGKTGGSHASPFTPVLIVLPSIAIFLREPFSRVSFYVILVAVVFTLTMKSPPRRYPDRTSVRKWAYGFISLSTLCLATFIAYLTRPF